MKWFMCFKSKHSFSDPIGDGSRGTWLKEGLAEFIHGADQEFMASWVMIHQMTKFVELTQCIGTGNEALVFK
jgi:hypothetical protein